MSTTTADDLPVPASRHPAQPAEPQVTPRRLIAFFALVFGMFMAIMDIQIVSSSLSEIQAGLSAGPDEISWVQTSYLIAEVIMIPLSGFLSRALSTRILFTLSAAGFTLTSLLCATATSLEEMILYRALQGFIGGGMIPTAFAASYMIFPKRAQGPVMALVGLTVTLAPTIGPTLGGYLTQLFSWHWLFLINLVPGVLATVLAWTLVDFDEPDWSLLSNFDYLGLASMAAFLGCMEYVLEEGNREDWFQSRLIFGLTVVSGLSGLIFLTRCLSARNPIVDLGAFRNRNFLVGSILTLFMGVGLYGLTYLYPLYLARVRGFNALQIGETVFVTGAFMFLCAPPVGILARRIDPRILIFAGFTGFAISTWLLIPVTNDWGFWELFLPQALRGASLMTCMVPINILALGTLPMNQVKNASGLFNLTRNLGGAMGLAWLTTFLNDRWDLHIARLMESVHWGAQLAEERLAEMTASFAATLGPDGELAAMKQMGLQLRGQGLVMAFSDVFYVLAIAFALLVFLIPLVQRPRAGGGGGGGH